MKNSFNVLGVAGSTRQGSYSTRALKIALEYVKKQGAEVRLLELNRIVLPLYDPSATASKEVEEAAKAIAWADAFILASPDYHGSMSGALKNFLDHFYEEFYEHHAKRSVDSDNTCTVCPRKKGKSKVPRTRVRKPVAFIACPIIHKSCPGK